METQQNQNQNNSSSQNQIEQNTLNKDINLKPPLIYGGTDVYIEGQKKNKSVLMKKNNKVWTKIIPVTNIVFLLIYLFWLVFVDLTIVAQAPVLTFFFLAMQIVFVVFCFFGILENFVFKNKFKNTRYGIVDSLIFLVIFFRNIIFGLNFIPLVQLYGMFYLYKLGIVLGVAYLLLIIFRFRKTNNASWD